MKAEVFVDTSGFYALLVKRDNRHTQASKVLTRASKQRTVFITTDYILDETATLFKARGLGHLIGQFFEYVLGSRACQIEWTDAERFGEVLSFFLKHSDHDWSFTDCLSFHVMKQRRIREALTKDANFAEAGFKLLLEA